MSRAQLRFRTFSWFPLRRIWRAPRWSWWGWWGGISAAGRAGAEHAAGFEFVFVDCPPSLGLLTLNALAAANGLLVPIQAEYFAMEGVSNLMTTIDEVRRFLNPGLTIDGILLTMYDERTNLAQQVVDEVRQVFRDLVFRTVVPRNVRLAEAPSFGRPIHAYDLRSRGSQAYLELGREYLERMEVIRGS